MSAAASPAGDDSAGGTHRARRAGIASAAGTADSGNGIFGLPSRVDRITFGTFVLVLGAVLLAFAAVAFALAAMPSRAVPVGVRQAFQRSRSNLAALGLFALAATTLLLLLVIAVS